jgi:chemotaxis protein CheD
MSVSGEIGGQVYHVVQGSFRISDRDGDTLTTILGSCVATCLYDPTVRVGGMNHFLLPDGGKGKGDLRRYGLHAMELLINALLKAGAQKHRLQAKLFGGAAMHDGLRDIGRSNAEFGGTQGRRLRYWPTTGRAQLRMMDSYEPIPTERPTQIGGPRSDDLTLF